MVLEDFHIEYKIKDRDYNLYWNKKDTDINGFVKDINAFLFKKIQVPFKVMLVETDARHRRRTRQERAFRGRLRGKDRYQFRGGA